MSEVIPTDTETDSLAWQHHLDALPQPLVKHFSVAISARDVVIIGGVTREGSIVQRYDVNTKITTSMPDLPLILEGHQSVRLGDHVYIIGVGLEFKNVLRMNISTISIEGRFAKVSVTNEPRFNHTVATHKSTMFTFGGFNSDTAEYCNIIDSNWRYLPPMDQPREGSSSVTIEDRIYILGGHNHRGDGFLSSVIILNTLDNTWDFESTPDMPIPLFRPTTIVIGKYIVALGGYNGRHNCASNRCFIFCKETNKWYESPSSTRLNTSRMNHSSVLLDDGRIVTSGGDNGGIELDSIESIHHIGLFPTEIRQQAIQTATHEQGQLPIHSAAEHGLKWEDGMQLLLTTYPDSLGVKSNAGDLPIVLAASGEDIDLSTVYEMFMAMLGLNLLCLEKVCQ